MTLAWAVGAVVIALASFVMGLTGFGIALVAMAFLPWVMSPVTAIVLLTLYALVFSIVVVVQLRHDLVPRALSRLSLKDFMKRLPSLDVEWAARVRREASRGRVLRYVVTATPRSVSARLTSVPASSAMGEACSSP